MSGGQWAKQIPLCSRRPWWHCLGFAWMETWTMNIIFADGQTREKYFQLFCQRKDALEVIVN